MNKKTKDSTPETVRRALGNAEIGLTQEIDETLQGEAVTKLVKESNRFFEHLPVMDTANNNTVGYLQILDDGRLIEPPTHQWVTSSAELEQPKVFFCKKKITTYEGAMCVIDGMDPAQGIVSVETTFLGNNSSMPHMLVLVRKFGTRPELSVGLSEFSRIELAGIQSIVLVRRLDNEDFVAAFSGFVVEQSCSTQGDTEELILSAARALPWKQTKKQMS